MADTIASRGLATSGGAHPASTLAARVSQAFAVWRQRRDLAHLPPYLRDDLGLTEDQVRRESRRPIWDVPDYWRF